MQWYKPNRRAVVLIVFMGLAPFASGALSQAIRTIKFIVPYAPGGPADTLARLLADQISNPRGPIFLIENRPGAATVIGTEDISRAEPDGNTVGMVSNSLVVLPQLRKLNYDPLKSFEPVCELVSFPPIIAVNSASPYHTLADLIHAARANPATLTLASIGPATASQIAVEMLKRMANIDMTFVPYPGYGPAINALLGEHVTAVLGDYSSVVEQLKAGKLRALATTLPRRIDELPTVPTVAESGYKDFEFEFWAGVVAPANTPQQLIAQLSGWFTDAMRFPLVKAKLVNLGLFPVGACGADFGAILHKEYDLYGHIIRDAHIKME